MKKIKTWATVISLILHIHTNAQSRADVNDGA
jgi:hypothetical protein